MLCRHLWPKVAAEVTPKQILYFLQLRASSQHHTSKFIGQSLRLADFVSSAARHYVQRLGQSRVIVLSFEEFPGCLKVVVVIIAINVLQTADRDLRAFNQQIPVKWPII